MDIGVVSQLTFSAVLLSAYWLFLCLLIVVIYRRKQHIRVRPAIVPTTADEMPDYIREVLSAAVGCLSPLGYAVCASGHAPRFGHEVQWWHIVFQEGVTRGERISIMCLLQGHILEVLVIAKTEFADGRHVSTDIRESCGRDSLMPGDLPMALPELVVTHQQKLREFPAGEKVGPAVGQEYAWLAARAAMVAEDVAKSKGWPRRGDAYRPTLSHAVRDTWRRWPLLARLTRPRPTRGFDVSPARRN